MCCYICKNYVNILKVQYLVFNQLMYRLIDDMRKYSFHKVVLKYADFLLI